MNVEPDNTSDVLVAFQDVLSKSEFSQIATSARPQLHVKPKMVFCILEEMLVPLVDMLVPLVMLRVRRIDI